MVLPKRKITLTDVIIIVLAVILTVASFTFLYLNKNDHTTATVTTADGEFTVDLGEDRTFGITSNGYRYTIIVENGEISVDEADCRDGICRNTRPVGKNGGTIVCLPGKLVISSSKEVRSDGEADVIIP